MKKLLTVIALASAVITVTPVFAADFSSEFVQEKITQHWELDILEITQRIDVKKRRELEKKSSEVSETKLQAFEKALKKLMQQEGSAEIDEATIIVMMSGFAQTEQDAQMIFMAPSEGDEMFPDQNELMLTDMSDYETSMMIEESLLLKADGSVVYPDTETNQDAEQSTDSDTDGNGTEDTMAKWSFNAEKQQIMLTEQQDGLSITASYKLVELSDSQLVLEGVQPNGSTRMIFSSQ